MQDRHLGLIAAGVAFYALFSLFPGLAALIALWGFLSDPQIVAGEVELLAEFLPENAYALVEAQVKALVAANQSTLGWATGLSLAVALWSARAGVGAMVRGINAIHGTETRGGLGHALGALALTGALIGLGVLLLASVVVLPVLLALLPPGPWTGLVPGFARWGTSIFAVLAAIALIYRYGPNRPGRRTAWITPGVVLSALLWAATSVAFSEYLANFGNYNQVYGSIGAVVALLTWFYLGSYFVLAGAAFNAELDRVRKGAGPRVTAPGAPRSRGSAGPADRP
jgi:membrane protein